MKGIASDGSPHKDGSTHRLIRRALDEIEKEGIKTERIPAGGRKISPCTACRKWFENKDKRCVQEHDMVHDCIEQMPEADLIIIGLPTYFASLTPEINASMDRACFVAKANDHMFRQKLGASVIAAWRAGGNLRM